MSSTNSTENKPFINVTALIDVLLVLLIIFMVAVPLKHSRFAAKLPAPPDEQVLPLHIHTLVVSLAPDRSLKLNSLADMGSIDDTAKLSAALIKLFRDRELNHTYRAEMLARTDLPEASRIERTVFIKAPRSIPYGDVMKVIDGIKGAGANPIGLQIDNLN